MDLAPSLLSIYDSLAQGTASQDGVDGSQSNSTTQSHDNQTANQDADADKENSQPPCPLIKVDTGQGKIDKVIHGMEENNVSHDLENDDGRKRPLSLGSVSSSSSSSSSLPRHTRKRPNLSQFDPVALGRSNMEKLDNLLYIDDDAPGAITDEEMSVDNDTVNSTKEDRYSFQSIPSLSSESDSQDKTKSGNESDQTSDIVPHIVNHISKLPLNNNKENVSFSSPGCTNFEDDSSFVSTPSKSFVEDSSFVSTPSKSPPVSPVVNPTKYISHVQRVVAEISDTEASYVEYLHQILNVSFSIISQRKVYTKRGHIIL